MTENANCFIEVGEKSDKEGETSQEEDTEAEEGEDTAEDEGEVTTDKKEDEEVIQFASLNASGVQKGPMLEGVGSKQPMLCIKNLINVECINQYINSLVIKFVKET